MLIKIDSIKNLYKHFGVEQEDFQLKLKDKSSYLNRIEKAKSGNKIRVIYHPLDCIPYELVIDKIKDDLNSLYNAPNCVFGYIKGRGTRKNASVHLSSRIVINIDIEEFFNSITSEHIYNALSNLNINNDIINEIINICTVDGILVTGFSCSPVISNLVFLPLDDAILAYCNSKKLRYTRYGDDITISSKDKVEEITPIIGDLREELEKYKFKLNEEKTKIQTRKYAQYVTGLTVNDNYKPRIPKNLKRCFRLETYYARKYGEKEHITKTGEKTKFFGGGTATYDGRKQYIGSIEGGEYINKLRKVKDIQEHSDIIDDITF